MSRRDIFLVCLLVVALVANSIVYVSAPTVRRANKIVAACRAMIEREYFRASDIIVSNKVELLSIVRQMIPSEKSDSGRHSYSVDTASSSCSESGNFEKVKFDYCIVGNVPYAKIEGEYYCEGELSPLGVLSKILKSGLLIGDVFYARAN